MADPLGVTQAAGRGADAIESAGEIGAALRSPQSHAGARKLVLVSMGGLLAINVYRADREPGSLYRRLWGTGVLGVMLSAVADFAPEIAGPFALLVFLGSLTNGGDRALQNALGAIGNGLPVGANVNPASNAAAAGPVAPLGPPINVTPSSAPTNPPATH